MWVIIKEKFNSLFDTFRAFFQEGNPAGSSKRLIAISSFFSGIGLCWASLTFGFPITDNILYLAISILSLSTGNYILGSKKKMKEDMVETVSTDVADKDVKNG